MSPEQRRRGVVLAALPLVAEHGSAVTTAQIARGAGIGEATIFRVFQDKDELLDAVVLEALDPATVLGVLGSIDVEQPLGARLVEAADALRAHLDRIGAVIGVLHASGHQRRGRGGPDAHHGDAQHRDEQHRDGGSREATQAAVLAAVADLFRPDEPRLRLPVDQLADMFLALFAGHGRFPGRGGTSLGTGELVDLFLYGAVAGTAAPGGESAPGGATAVRS